MRRRRGAVAVEFAFSLPVMFTLIAGVIEWGWYLHREVAVTQAVRDGALAGCVHVVPADAEGVASARTETSLDVAGLDGDAATITATISATADGDMISVTAEMPYTGILNLLPTPATMRATATFRMVVQ